MKRGMEPFLVLNRTISSKSAHIGPKIGLKQPSLLQNQLIRFRVYAVDLGEWFYWMWDIKQCFSNSFLLFFSITVVSTALLSSGDW